MKKIKYFIYDECNEFFLNKLLNQNEYKIFNFRKLFNTKYKKLFFLLKYLTLNFFSFKKLKILINDGFFIAFVCNEIELSKPKFVITTTDNDLRFYLLKQYFDEKIKFIALQNGIRSKFHDMFDNSILLSKKNLTADYYFSFGHSIKKIINKYIKVNVIPIGSFKSNFINIRNKSLNYHKNNCILYVSSYRNKKKTEIFDISSTKKIVYWKDFIDEEIFLIKNLKNYCIKNNLLLSIAGSSLGISDNEKKFYENILRNCKWKIYNRKSVFSNYQLLDNFEIIVNACSTLGYEALGRDKKVAFFSRKFSPYKDWYYGWPDQIIKKGFFYSDDCSQHEVNRVINNLRSVKKAEWSSILLKEKNKNMHFYSGNSKLKGFIK
tara:strand:- start:145 stop:1278 length:1134 start_codon:yes stop_codon:yes gene_type:complete